MHISGRFAAYKSRLPWMDPLRRCPSRPQRHTQRWTLIVINGRRSKADHVSSATLVPRLGCFGLVCSDPLRCTESISSTKLARTHDLQQSGLRHSPLNK